MESQEPQQESRWGFRGMTVRNWLELLIIPLALVIIGYLFTMQQEARQRDTEEQRAQDEALQAYLDEMGTLMLEKDLRSPEQDSEVRTLARARTLTVLSRLEGDRKAHVVLFLNEAELLEKDRLVVDLSGADLSEAFLPVADLRGADLADATLESATLIGAKLSNANLRDADLEGARLDFADLSDADLSDAYLENANLSNANLRGAQVEDYHDQQVKSLTDATMPDGSKHP